MKTLSAPYATGILAACLWCCSDDGAARGNMSHARDASSTPNNAAQDAAMTAIDASTHTIDAAAHATDAALHDASPMHVPAPDAAHDAGGTVAATGCDASGLTWKTANKTSYTSYPDPGSEECIKYSGCEYEGMFAACDDTKPESWVKAHAIVAAFPDFDTLRLHDLCLRSGSKMIVVTVLDTCADSDCDGCCTENKGSADELIDVESYTDARWGVQDSRIEWADLGPTRGDGCK